ncbi:non-ribosomal peptide synthase/polyketide synthase [Caldimonas brevitalea]|nr:non-ribosomal peptide synthase/polyketide synthase [Caldimonas brevitalea]
MTDLLALLDARGLTLALKGQDLAVSGDEQALKDAALISLLRQHKPALIELLRRGDYAARGSDAVTVPPLRVPPDAQRITPEMLTLVELDQQALDTIVAGVEGGAANVQDIYPLAPLQEGMLFHHLLNPAADVYTERYLLSFRSRARLDRFLAALQQVIARHDVLRTGIAWEGLAQPVQVVRRQTTLPVAYLDLDPRDGPIADQLEARFEPGRYRLDLRQAPLMHCHAAEDATEARWLLSVLAHHIAVDHTTLALLVEEAQAIESGRGAELRPPVPFRNFVAQARLGVSQEEHERFFRAMLSDIDAPTAPFGLLDVQGDGRAITEASEVLPAALAQALRARARQLGVSAASLMHLAWALVLARMTGRSAVVFGTVLFGRMKGGADADRAMGLFMNTLPLRVDIDGQGVEAGVKRVNTLLAQLLRHEHAPLALAQRCSGVPAQTPLFTSLLNYRHSAPAESDAGAGDEDGVEMLRGHERTNYPLTLSVDDLGQGFALTVQAGPGVAAERVCAFVRTALEEIVTSLQDTPQQPLRQLDVLPAGEREQVLHRWNATAQRYAEHDRCLHEMFEAQVQRTPEAIAVVAGEQRVSYAELNARANQLARELRRRGVGPDQRVVVCLQRSVEMVVALLATLKAGGAYVPLDPDYPEERLRHMLHDSAPVVVLVDAAGREALGQGGLDLQADSAAWSSLSTDNLASTGLTKRNLAYVIYTSGSTGRPKGVMNEHRGVVNRLLWMQQAYGLGEHDVVLQKTPFSFDVSVWEFFWPLMTGAQLVMARPEGHKDPAYLAQLIQAAGVTTLHFVPSMLQVFLGHEGAAACRSLQRVICSGEALPAALARSCLAQLPKAQLHNLYGPTEAAVDVTAWTCEPGKVGTSVPIGRPIANTQMYILDEQRRPVPPGVAGELYIGGVQVARGYLNLPELTAERFIADPFSADPEARLYKTGDLGRWREDGAIDYLGRNDFQVKIRGLRIELGEIEARLAQLDGVQEVVVLAREDQPGDQRLVAYYSGEAAPEALRQHAAQGLPAYMVPAAYVQIEHWPVTPNGKLDRKALPAPEGGAYASQVYEAPQGRTEQVLAGLWAELLQVERVGRHDNFFALGGHSLLAVQLISRVRKALDVDLPLAALFEQPVLSQLAARLAGEERALQAAIEAADRSAPLPLSPAQQRLWFLAQMEGVSQAYHVSGAVRLRGELKTDALQRALQGVVDRHETLRTRFAVVDGEPVQEVAAQARLPIELRDLRQASDIETSARQLVDAHATRPFDLRQDLPVRVLLLQLGEQEHVLQVVMHHIVCDGWSVGVLLDEVSRLYGTFAADRPDPLPPLALQYADYAAWQRRGLAEGRLQSEAAYWLEALAGAPALLELPTDRPRPAQQDHRGDVVPVQLDTALSQALKTLSQRHGVTLYMTLLASWAALLSRLSGQAEVVIGSPVAGRQRAELEPLIGFFVNTLALRLDLKAASGAELLQHTKARVLAAQQHQDLPFDQVVEAVQPPRSLSHTPLFQVMFDWQNAPTGELQMPGLDVQALDTAQTTAQFDLTLSLHEGEAGIAGVLNYATALFERATVQRYLDYWRELLQALVADVQQPVSRLPLLPEAERQQLLHGWNEIRDEYPRYCLHQRFEAQAAATPEGIALVHGEEQLSYGEMNARANRLAHHLRKEHGIGPDSLVALCTERSVDMVVALLATLKAGGAYVPLDPAYASDRLLATLQDSQPRLVLLDARGRQALGQLDGLPVIDLQADAPHWADGPTDNLDVGVQPQHLAYVIYTSGSTGQPKGVMVEHAQVARLFGATAAWFGFGSEDRWSLFHSIGFDFSVWEIWGALLHGGRLVIVPLETARSPVAFHQLLCEQGITVLNQTPSAFQQLIAAQGEAHQPHQLRHIVFGGEALELRTLKPWYEREINRDTQLSNMYGITETTVHVTWRALQPGDAERPGPSPIGGRIPDLRLYVLDAERQPVPVGVTGELYVGGAGVARGYLNRAELTAQRFVDNPFVPGERLYKTGDLGRWLIDGTLEYLGRNDFQVKIRGFRIELGEIEAQLAVLPGVREVVVLAREDQPGDKRLVAYYTGEDAPPAEVLRQQAVQQLPPYMVPAAYVRLAQLPLTPNGKLDRQALPAPDSQAYVSRAYAAPEGEVEQTLAQLWAELLQLERVGRHDNFFDLGGHSLLAVQLVSRLRERLEVELPLADLFEHPELARLARRVQATARSPHAAIPPADRQAPLPLSLAQQRLWFLTQMEGASEAYHISGAVQLSGPLDTAVLRRALQHIVNRHEALRTRFTLHQGQPVQALLAQAELRIDEQDLSGQADADATVRRRLDEHAERAFDLRQQLPLRVLLLRLGEHEHVLQVVMHHIVSDGWSVAVFLEELSQTYAAWLEGDADPLSPLAIQYADYAAWQRDRLAGGALEHQTDFWRRTLAAAPALLALPTDRPRPALQDHAGASLEVRLEPRLSQALKDLGRQHGVTPYMCLLASWAALLARLSGQDEVVIGSPVAGRNRAEVEPLIGFFVNTLALRIDLGQDRTVAELLHHIKSQVLAAQQHQDLPFDQVVEAVKPARSLAHTPLFQVMLDWQNTPDGELTMPGLALTPLATPQTRAHFDLTLTLQDTGDDIRGTLNYATALFDADTVQAHLRHWLTLLDAMVADDTQAVARLPVLDAAQRHQLLVEWNGTAGDAGQEGCLHELFEAQVRRTPAALAVICGDRQLSYRELNARANQLARELRARGVGPDRLVAVCAERGVDLMVALLGVLKAGGAYVPLDPGYPAQRLQHMLEDAAPSVLLTQRHLEPLLPAHGAEVLRLDEDWPRIARHDDGDLDTQAVGLSPRQLAYVLFTSGSTGRPKGVMIEHRSIVNYACHAARQFDVQNGHGSLVFTSFSFDLTLTSVYPPLLCGRPVRLCPEGNDLAVWREQLLAGRELAPVKLTPSHLALLQQALPADAVAGRIRTLVLGGEPLKGAALQWWREQAPEMRIFNHYGPTEATVGCVVHEVTGPLPDGAVPIGRPITHMRIYVLDALRQPVPVGVLGEIYIGGAGVARGYLGRPDLTEERFLPDPYAAEADARMYRTGDVARWRADGTLEYLGRNDHQVKLRGFRIELGEIEAVLCRHEGVAQAAVIAREDQPGDQRLVAYCTGEAALDPEALRRHVAASLPHYMVPADVVQLAELPLTPNGKLDRKALPAPDARAQRATGEHQPPIGATEVALAGLWAELLKLERVGRHDNFFELGGHSLLAVSLIERMRRAGLHADVRALFTAPTLADLALQVQAEGHDVEVPPNRIPPDATHLTPEMLTLVTLDPDSLERVVAGVEGGAANVQDIYPLAPLQEGMLFHHLLNPEADAYVEAYQVAFKSKARLESFLAALQQVVDRHDILRTGIAWEQLEQPLQVVRRQAQLPVEWIEFDPAEGDIAAQLQAHCDPHKARLDVRQAPLLRCHVAQDLPHGRWLLGVVAHHLAVDHTTLELLVDEAQAIEQGRGEALAPPAPFRNFVAQARLGVTAAEHEAFFKTLLGDIDEPTAPFGLLDVRGDGRGIAEAAQALPPALARDVRQQARKLGVSPATLMHQAWALVLARTTGRQDVVFGTVLFGRMQGGAQADRVLGLFINTLPVRIAVDDQGVATALQRTHALLAQLLRHEHAPLALAQRCSAVPARSPLFTSLLNYRYSAEAAEHGAPAAGADEVEFLGNHERTNYPLTLSVDDQGEGFLLTAQVSAGVAPERVCAFMQTALEQLLQALQDDPQRASRTLDVLPPAEREQLLLGWNDTAAELPGGLCVHQLFEAQAQRTPDATALVCGEQRYSYAELNRRANQLAHHLRGLGAGPDGLVALAVERSPEMVVGVLGILKSGAAYVPLDPAYPADRLAYMVEDARPLCLLTQRSLQSLLPAGGVPQVLLDEQWPEIAAGATSNPAVSGLSPHHLAYVIYTSGSTGRPKGVMVEHGNVVNFLLSMSQAPGIRADDVLLAVTSLSFDIAGLELFLPLLCGARIVLATREDAADAERLRALMERWAVSIMQATPSTWRLLMQQDWPVLPRPLKVLCGGEALPVNLAEQLLERVPEVWNLYGPTETTIWSTLARLTEAAPHIGRPIANTRVYVLDAAQQPVPVGVPGELYIGGVGVTRGYLGRPELTAERFVQDPFEPGQRLYRTGDLARWQPDGTLAYLGRNDFQVKLRGFRIELGEIEASLTACEGVREAVVVARESGEGDPRLVAYLVVSDAQPLDAAALRQQLARRLADYMVPSAFVTLDAFPLTPNGKIDRKALPAPDASALATRAYEPPQGATEQAVAEIWQSLLGAERVGRQDDFFELGGHSLLAVQLIARVRRVMGLDVALRELFTHTTLAGFAEALAQARRSTAVPIVPVDRRQPLPLSWAQQSLWVLAQVDPAASLAYHMPAALRLRGTLDRVALRRALDRVVARHEALRTRFDAVDGEAVQIIADEDVGFALAERDLADLHESEREFAVTRLATDEAATAFDLAQGPLIRGQLLRLAADEHVLLITQHHIVSDGWSIGVLVEELSALYAAYAQGRPDPLPPLTLQYADYAAWQRGWLQGEVLQRQLEFWKARLAGAPTLLELPTDRPRPAVQSHVGGRMPLALPAPLVADLKALGQRHGATLFMTLMAGWSALLSRLSGQHDIVVGTPVANRHRTELEPLIGFFVNTLALRVQVDDDASVAELLAQVRSTTLAAYEHQELPLEQVIDALQLTRSLSHNPLFQATLTLHNTPQGQEVALPGLSLSGLDQANHTAPFDVSLLLDETEEGVVGHLQYASDLFDDNTVARWAGHLVRLLESMTEDAGRRVGDLDLLDAAARDQVLVRFNDTARAYPHDGLIHQVFEAWAERTPYATALSGEGGRLNYAELNRRANRLAHHLLSLGVRPDDRVAICMERGLEMVVAMLATLKAGGAYLPLDPSYPPDRLAHMLADSTPVALLTVSDLQSRLPASPGLPQPVVVVDAMAEALAVLPETNPDAMALGLQARHLAYVIYTSGSTGTPKGVMVEHRNVLRLAVNGGFAPLTPDDCIAHGANPVFDAATWEIWGGLLNGARVCVVPQAVMLDPAGLRATLQAEGVSALWLTVGLFNQYADVLADSFGQLRYLITGGDALDPRIIARTLAGPRPPQHLLNGYGPTETTTFATTFHITALPPGAHGVPIGRPIGNTSVYILDAHHSPVPVGLVGEIYIGGAGVARGYLARPELTAERFLRDPFSADPTARMYKTGDRGRWLPDGTIEFHGRSDFQVKIRGFRVELGEIEARLAEVEGVREVAVLARTDEAGDQRLLAYYSAAQALAPARLRQQLAQSLPEYMLPAAFVHLEAMPLTPNGKLDRKALPEPQPQTAVVVPDGSPPPHDAPQGEIEAAVAQLWCELLKLERVGRYDSFFDLGGNSLLGVRLMSRLRQTLGVDLTLRPLFADPTLSGFAAAVAGKSAQPLASNLTPFRRSGTSRPVFFIHPGLGEIGYVTALLPGIDPDVPVYGLSAIGYVKGEQPLTSLEEMAAAYIQAIRQVQPQGPYRLVGWCAGGAIGWEMAQQLLGVDERVEFLGLIDSPSYAPVDPSPLASVLSRVPDDIPEDLRSRLHQLADAGDTRGMLAACQDDGFLPAEMPLDVLERYLAVQHTLKLARLAYTLPRLPIKATLFPATENPFPGWMVNGWDTVAAEVERIQVGGNHMSMIEPPHAADLGATISAELRRAEADPPDCGAFRHDPVVMVKAGTGGAARGRTLHCIAGAGASVTSFADLAQALPEHLALHGLQPRGLCGQLVPHHDVTAAARAYLEAIRPAADGRPYHLLGHSYGGWVAYEMARQLSAAGQQVATLTVLDTEPPDELANAHPRRSRLEALLKLCELFELRLGRPLGLSRGDLEAQDRGAQLRLLHAALAGAKLWPASASSEALEGMVRVFEAHLNTRYRPQGAWPGVLQVVAVADHTATAAEWETALLQRWRPFAAQVQLLRGEGNHMTMLQPPHVASLARRLDQDLMLPVGG